ncbi:hypothetical protein KV557_18305, partial [Kitasatospora aureofaciens]|uniref:hypothetical protein n=1 Tax=Kitasatospora aureofaciens TaxID=1894 RepID=UPI001C4431D8
RPGNRSPPLTLLRTGTALRAAVARMRFPPGLKAGIPAQDQGMDAAKGSATLDGRALTPEVLGSTRSG